MISRFYAAGLAGALVFGVVSISTETFGRGGAFGGGFGGRAFSMSSGFHPGAFRAPAQGFSHHAGSPFNHRRLGPAVPLIGPGAYSYGGYDYAPGYPAPAYQPPNDDSEITTGAIPSARVVPYGAYPYPVVIRRPGCQTQAVTVPAEDGSGDRTINIVRC
jgi:hypothetical protein